MCPPSCSVASRLARGLRVQLCLLTMLGALLAGRQARADVGFMGAASNRAAGTRTLRIPASGTITTDASGAGYVTVGVALSDVSYQVTRMGLFLDGPGGQVALVPARQTFRNATNVSPFCRSELWGAAVVKGATNAFVTVEVEPMTGAPAAPDLAGSMVSFSNVGGTSINPPCCANSANDGAGGSTISKTMIGNSRGDALFNSVCVSWTGTTPGTPTPDPAEDPEMVPRTFVTLGRLQHFSGTSPGANVAPPATSARSLRWLQSGSRTWGLVGLILFGTGSSAVSDAGAPVDMGAPPVDMGAPPVDMGAPPVDMRAPLDMGPDLRPVDTTSPPPDMTGADVTPAPADTRGDAIPAGPIPEPPDTAARVPDAAAPDLDGGVVTTAPFDWRVGCACDLGHARGGGGAPALLLVVFVPLLLARRRP
jgi:hypothetical protein